MLVADLSHQSDAEANCPEVITEDSKKTYKGGCTDKSGRTWFGTAITEEFSQETSSLGLIRYEGFGSEFRQARSSPTGSCFPGTAHARGR